MRLRHIEIFQAIRQTGSISAAAQLLHVSQPAVSNAIKLAEAKVGKKSDRAFEMAAAFRAATLALRAD